MLRKAVFRLRISAVFGREILKNTQVSHQTYRKFRVNNPPSLIWFSRMGDAQSVSSGIKASVIGLLILGMILPTSICLSITDLPESNSVERPDKVRLTEEEWRKKLTSEQFQVCRRKGTERAWTGDLLDNKKKGVYYCTACGCDLFSSTTKFDSGSGWPSFFDVVKDKDSGISNVEVHTDRSHGMVRTEVLCGKCDSHLGHVFNDGPQPTGLRFCINSVSIGFREEVNSEL